MALGALERNLQIWFNSAMCRLELLKEWLQSWKVQPVSGRQVSHRQTRRFTIWLLLTTRHQPSQTLTFIYFTFHDARWEIASLEEAEGIYTYKGELGPSCNSQHKYNNLYNMVNKKYGFHAFPHDLWCTNKVESIFPLSCMMIRVLKM